MLYTCCRAMSLICTRMLITNDPVLKLNYLTFDIESASNKINVDPSLPVKGPYSQGDIAAFGSNAGQQCIGMRLICVL